MRTISHYWSKLPYLSNGTIFVIVCWLLVFDGYGLYLLLSSSHFQSSISIRLFQPVSVLGSNDSLLDPVPIPTRSDLSDLTCQFPIMDPWDKTIIHLIEHNRQFNCKIVQPWLILVDSEGRLRFNQTELRAQMQLSDKENKAFRCHWRSVWKTEGTDWEIASSKDEPLKLSIETRVTFEKDCIQVQCFRNESIVYEFVHAYPRDLRSKAVPSDEDHLSVLMFVIDSASLSTFRRSLPSTYKYVTETMAANVFYGYNKVGLNTFPNMVPIFMNKRVEGSNPNFKDELGGGYRSIFFDDWNFIWKNFSQNGYLTGYIEDKPTYGTFHYLKKGFNKSPFDWYLRPYFMARQDSTVYNKSSKYCYGNTPKISKEINVSRAILERYRRSRYFVWTFNSELSHDYLNELERADEDILLYFKNLHENNLLNNTVALVMGDHGLRMTEIRNTHVGFIEERMPFYSIILPPWFYRKYPHIKKSLRQNAYRLSSPFDVHATLSDILNGNYRGSQRPLTERSFSQFYDLPTNRTCLSAGIPVPYCTCLDAAKTLNTTDPNVLEAAGMLVDFINYHLLGNVSDKCVPWTFMHVERVEAQTIRQLALASQISLKDVQATPTRSKRELRETMHLQLGVRVSPIDALFEGMVQIDGASGNMTIIEPISRINRYGNTSACMDSYLLRPFCYCTTNISV